MKYTKEYLLSHFVLIWINDKSDSDFINKYMGNPGYTIGNKCFITYLDFRDRKFTNGISKERAKHEDFKDYECINCSTLMNSNYSIC